MEAVALAGSDAGRQPTAMHRDEGIHWLEWTAAVVGSLLSLGGLLDWVRVLL